MLPPLARFPHFYSIEEPPHVVCHLAGQDA
jgi:hypothetical protein